MQYSSYRELPKDYKRMFLQRHKQLISSLGDNKEKLLKVINKLASIYSADNYYEDVEQSIIYNLFNSSATNNELFSTSLEEAKNGLKDKMEKTTLGREDFINKELLEIRKCYPLIDIEKPNMEEKENLSKLIKFFKQVGYQLCIDGHPDDFNLIRQKFIINFSDVLNAADIGYSRSMKKTRTFVNFFGFVVVGFVHAHYEKYLKGLLINSIDKRENSDNSNGVIATKINQSSFKQKYLLLREFGMLESSQFENLTAVKKSKLFGILFNMESEGIRQDLSKVNDFIHEGNNKEELQKLLTEINQYKKSKKM